MFQSPNYPEEYPPETHKLWIITVEPDMVVHIKPVGQFSIHYGFFRCDHVYLEVKFKVFNK